MTKTPVLELKNLTKTYIKTSLLKKEKTEVLKGINLTLKEGETTALMGPSGCGKTTIIKIILGLEKQDGGQVFILGKDLSKISAKELRNTLAQIGVVFQDPYSSLDPRQTIESILSEPFLIHKKPFTKETLVQALKEVALSESDLKKYPHQFSGGQRQRISIARALLLKPKLIIADEPTTALDVTIQGQILELIKKIQKERDLSVIFITHDLGVVANMADRVAVMYAGKIVEYGTSEDIFYDPKHPYTWALLSSIPDIDSKERLDAIPGTPPNMIYPPKGDAFAARSKYAMKIDYEEEPPFFKLSETHYAATWLLHPSAPKVEMPKIVSERIKNSLKTGKEAK